MTTIPVTRRRARGGLLRRIAVALTLVATLALSGCSLLPALTVEQVPLPKPGGLSGGMTLSAEFRNALNLPEQAKVKLHGNIVGQVDAIVVDGYVARVKMSLEKGLQLPRETRAELRQATPLGDVFLALEPPATPTNPGLLLADGDTIGLDKTGAAATIEDLLVSLSTYVGNGVFDGLVQIGHELNNAVGGRAPELQTLVREFTSAFQKMNANTAELDRSIRALGTVSRDLADGRKQLIDSLTALNPALTTINGQIDAIQTTLAKTRATSAALNDFLSTQKGNTESLFRQLNTFAIQLDRAAAQFGPFAENLAAADRALARSTKGNSLAGSLRLQWLTTGFGQDSGSRLWEPSDIPAAQNSIRDTLMRVYSRITGTNGCCPR